VTAATRPPTPSRFKLGEVAVCSQAGRGGELAEGPLAYTSGVETLVLPLF